MKSIAVVAVGVLAVTGCASSTQKYDPPSVIRIENSRHIDKPFDAAWDSLVRQVSSDFFVINNIDKSSRLINVSFSSQSPASYVDCGRSERTFKNARGEHRYIYNSAESSRFTAASPQGAAFNFDRNTHLSGRANIYIAPEDGGTQVTVNAKYNLTIDLSVFDMQGRRVDKTSFLVDFSTKQSGESEGVSCVSRGTIERDILDMAQL